MAGSLIGFVFFFVGTTNNPEVTPIPFLIGLGLICVNVSINIVVFVIAFTEAFKE